MVQSPRLKKVNPLLPIFFFLFIFLLSIVIVFPKIDSIVVHNLNRYEIERQKLIDEYNSIVVNTTQSKELIVIKSDLLENQKLIKQRLEILNKLNDLNIKYLKYNNYQINNVIQGYRVNDENINTYNLNVLNSIENKLNSIDYYNTLSDISMCLKGLPNKYKVDECKIFINNLNESSEIYKKSNSYLNSYNMQKTDTKKLKLNEIITLINKEIGKLEVIINKEIY